MTRAGLKHQTGLMSIAAHAIHHVGVSAVQVHENITGVLVPGLRANEDIETLAVASPQEADRCRLEQLVGGPHTFARKRAMRIGVDQSEAVEIMRHRCELAADGLHSEHESRLHHARHHASE
jgi:hypothetical protein